MTGVKRGMVATSSLVIARSVAMIDPDFRIARVPDRNSSVSDCFDYPSNRNRGE